METNVKKIDLAARSNAYFEKQKASLRMKAKEYVENTVIGYLVSLADKGNKSATINCPKGLYATDIIEELEAAVDCTAKRAGVTSSKINIHW